MPTKPPPAAATDPGGRTLLRWLHLGRLTLVTGVFLGIVLVWDSAGTEEVVLASSMFAVGVAFTAWALWSTEVRGRVPGESRLYLQVFLDVLLVTGTVHITGGASSDFSPLYIPVIAAGALLLPLSGGVLMGIMASALFFADIVLFQGGRLDASVALQLLLFAGVAVITGILGDRLRRAGVQLGQVESELRQLRLDTSEILDTLSTGVLTVDGTGRVAYLNEAGAQLLGVDGTNREGISVEKLLGKTAPALTRLLLTSVRDRVPVLRFKATVVRDGEPIVLGVSTTVMDREGADRAPSVTALFQDITHHERMDLLDRRNQRLEAVAELSASLAHEIKNPLASIRSSVEQLAGDGLETGDRDVLQRLVLTESDRLSRLLSDFLEFSAVRKARSRQVDLASVTRDAVRLAQAHPDAPEGVRVACAGLEEPHYIPGDSDLLHRAIYNLTLNALQFSGVQGTVRVTLSDHRTEPPPDPVEVERPLRLAIRDTGPGISEDDVSRIFDPFYTTRAGGSGLGLAVVHRAVEAHRGVILGGNARDGGAEFVLYLPADEAVHE